LQTSGASTGHALLAENPALRQRKTAMANLSEIAHGGPETIALDGPAWKRINAEPQPNNDR